MNSQGESLVVAVGDDGRFTDRNTEFKGRSVKEADKDFFLAMKVIMVDLALLETACVLIKQRIKIQR